MDGFSVVNVEVGSERGEVKEGGTSSDDEFYEPPTKKSKLLDAELAAAKQEVVKSTRVLLKFFRLR